MLTASARDRGIPIFGSVDYHGAGDPEISDAPDFRDTFPPHCLQGTPGQEKVPETRPDNPLWIGPAPWEPAILVERVETHGGEVYFRKTRFDVFSNPNVEPVLQAVRPDHIIVYGVALDVCDAYAVEGFLQRETARITLVRDASHPIDPARADALVREWAAKGVGITTTDEIVGRLS